MKTYSQDLRECVVRACDLNLGTRQQIAHFFSVSTAWIRRLLQRRRQTGSAAPRPHAGGPQPKWTPHHNQCLVVLIREHPDATLQELRDQLGAQVHLSTICRAAQRLGIRRKKKVLQAAEQDRPDVQHKRATFRGRCRGVNPTRFVFLDETGANTSMARLYGRALMGQRVVDTVPLGQWKALTLISAMRADGVFAPLVFEGATDSLAFLTYVKEVLVPELRPGDIVVLDNLKPHKQRAIGRLIRKVGAGVWYLPPYSPDYNPIEKIFSKIKTFLRTAAARTTETLIHAMGQALDTVTALDCLNCFEHYGYHATPVCKPL